MTLFELFCLSKALHISVQNGTLAGATTPIYLVHFDDDPSSFSLRSFLNHEGRLDASNFSTSIILFTKGLVFYTSFAYTGNYSIMAFLDPEPPLDAESSFSRSDIFNVREPLNSEVEKRDLVSSPTGSSRHSIFGSAYITDLVLIISTALAAPSFVSVVMISIYLCFNKRRRRVSVKDLSSRDSRSSLWGTSESYVHPEFHSKLSANPTSPYPGSDSLPYVHTPGPQTNELSHPPRNSEEKSHSQRNQENGAIPYPPSGSRSMEVYEFPVNMRYPRDALPSSATDSQSYTRSFSPEATEHSISAPYISEDMPPSRRIPRNRTVAYPLSRNSPMGLREFVTNLRNSSQGEGLVMFPEHDLPEHGDVAKLWNYIGYLKGQLELARALGYLSPLPSPGSGGENGFPDISPSVAERVLAPSRRSSIFY